MKNVINIEYIRSRLKYNSETGVFVWLDGPCKGKRAGCVLSNGYINIGILGKSLGAHRLAWGYVYGYVPKQIDHINGDPSDNRIANLRPSNQSQNKQNARIRRDSRSGFKGVSWSVDHKKWRAYIGPRSSVKFLGYFDDPSLAHAAYVGAAKTMYGEFANAGFDK